MSQTKNQLLDIQRILTISQELVADRPFDEILHRIVQVAADLVNCESVGILLLDEPTNTLRFVAATLYQDRLFDFPVPIESSIAGAAITSGQLVSVPDVRIDPRYYPRIAELLNFPVHSLLAAPLKFKDRKIGVLEAENKKDGLEFDETDAQIMTALAAQVTIALENARQIERYKQLAQDEQDQRKTAEALQLASAALTRTLDYDQVIDNILERVSTVIPFDTCNVMMIEKGDIARVYRGRGYEQVGTASTLQSTTLNVSTVIGLRRMYETRQPILILDATHDSEWIYSRPEHNWIRSYIGAPIILRDTVVGFLNAMSGTPNLYNQVLAERLQAFAYHAAIALENARLYKQAQEEIAERIKIEDELLHHRHHLEELVKERTREIHRMAITDPLTGIFNRRHLISLGERAINHSKRYSHTLTAMMIDIDYFKKINDTYGHAAGDEALRKLADQIRQALRTTDILGRYGGEEFVVLMPETDLASGHKIAERLLHMVRELNIRSDKTEFGITISVGLAEQSQANAQTLDDLIDQADKALYTAKQSGRNRVVLQSGL
ncbi:diguanylate cyclase [Candidatus Villigracilis affinis]|uniref:sensor domain-containing diguanylate cyclase n=1 Tax=Candidatus Villigracilis affinis TaxID=3140682 RepID=UPI001D1C2879|nr:sensor domain-containing diguanylate cyclase [Anaerolineales bacterium]